MKKATKHVLKEAKVMRNEPNTTYRKYKESADMSLAAHPISKPRLDIYPIWTPIIAAEERKLQLSSVYITWESCVFYVDRLLNVDFYFDSTMIFIDSGR
jgi:hypothetical protein